MDENLDPLTTSSLQMIGIDLAFLTAYSMNQSVSKQQQNVQTSAHYWVQESLFSLV